jgi:hypothetical protein
MEKQSWQLRQAQVPKEPGADRPLRGEDQPLLGFTRCGLRANIGRRLAKRREQRRPKVEVCGMYVAVLNCGHGFVRNSVRPDYAVRPECRRPPAARSRFLCSESGWHGL